MRLILFDLFYISSVLVYVSPFIYFGFLIPKLWAEWIVVSITFQIRDELKLLKILNYHISSFDDWSIYLLYSLYWQIYEFLTHKFPERINQAVDDEVNGAHEFKSAIICKVCVCLSVCLCVYVCLSVCLCLSINMFNFIFYGLFNALFHRVLFNRPSFVILSILCFRLLVLLFHFQSINLRILCVGKACRYFINVMVRRLAWPV